MNQIMQYLGSIKGRPDHPGLVRFFKCLPATDVSYTYGERGGYPKIYYVHCSNHFIKIEEYSASAFTVCHFVTNMRRPDGTWVL